MISPEAMHRSTTPPIPPLRTRDYSQRIAAAMRDGSGQHRPHVFTMYALPPHWTWVQGKLVVTRAFDEAARAGLTPGGIVLAMNGTPTADIIGRREQILSNLHPQLNRCMRRSGPSMARSTGVAVKSCGDRGRDRWAVAGA
jgi:hypothetical protein